MAVLDASAVLEIVLSTPVGIQAFVHLQASGETMHAPHLVDVEVTHALRRLAKLRQIPAADAGFAIDALAQLRLQRHSHLLLLPRMWELRESLSAYDAAYIALAEALGSPLITRDAKLSRSHGHRATIELLT